MAAIRGSHTKPELLVRKALHAAGFRYRLNARDLPGKPDLVFPKYKAAMFVNGCFWHGHDCPLFRWPGTRQDFWRTKIGRTIERDREVGAALDHIGWRVLTVWECALKGPGRVSANVLSAGVAQWLRSDARTGEFRGDLAGG